MQRSSDATFQLGPGVSQLRQSRIHLHDDPSMYVNAVNQEFNAFLETVAADKSAL